MIMVMVMVMVVIRHNFIPFNSFTSNILYFYLTIKNLNSTRNLKKFLGNLVENIFLFKLHSNYSNGCRFTIVSSLSGPVETIAIGTSHNISNIVKYALALLGKSCQDFTPNVLSFQPGTVS